MDEQTIRTYDKLALEYDVETSDFWNRFPADAIEAFSRVARLHDGRSGTVLDVGSGPGRDGLLLAKTGCSVTCLDASQSMVDICARKGLKAIKGDFLNLPFADETFDGVWAYTSLLHIKKADMPDALAEIYRVLKSNGAFGVGLIEGEGEMYHTSAGVDMPRWFAYYAKKEIEDALIAAGFSIIELHEFKPRLKNYLNYIAKKC